ncbi:hypothetical protein HH308_22890 [Gordonia sp. TBRC 11910]|uniref:PucR C-terminal helix-turn-helix domain-containing protein n=1 Tax=Gordonia asplenii TaxID=2725283 RepID=A0A848KZQ6_9ACTN|nr:helix-turn-helix domain-containing protein [Gordonia asplenii]NMO04066.1 hypothetical protein [Gordonia asplenii]
MDSVTTPQEWLHRFAQESEDGAQLDRLVDMVNRRIISTLPDLDSDATFLAELHASTRAHWRGFAAKVARDDFEVQLGSEAFDLARTLARRGAELPVLLSIYRVGQRAVWTYITGILTDDVVDAELRSTILMQFWGRMQDWLDTAVEEMIMAYTAEREEWQRGSLARRSEVVQAILGGQTVDVGAASAALTYPLDQWHVAFVVGVADDAPDADVQHLLDTTARAVAGDVGSHNLLAVSSGSRAMWCWVATAAPADGRLCCTEPLASVASGTSSRGIDGFRDSHLEALAAQSVSRGRPYTAYADVELTCLAYGLTGREGARRMARRELGQLAAADDTTARLRDTLRVYLSSAGNAHVAGERLTVHPNTIRYRIRQAEELLGHGVDERRVYVELALHIVDAW